MPDIIVDQPEFIVQRINTRKGLYRLIVRSDAAAGVNYILQTGSDVTVTFPLPIQVRIRKILFTHTTSTATTLSEDELKLYVDLHIFETSAAPVRYWNPSGWSQTGYKEFAEGFEEMVQGVKITTNSTNTDRVYLALDVQVVST